MRVEQKGNVKNSVGRLLFVLLAFFGQIAWIVLLFIRLNSYSVQISLFSSILAFCVVLGIYNGDSNAAFKMPWIILILVFPVLGVCIYLMLGHKYATARTRQHFETIHNNLQQYLKQKEGILSELEQRDWGIANQFRYLSNQEGYPVYNNTKITYYADAADGFAAQIEDLKQAKKFIFLEYHAIQEAVAFDKMLAVLKQKVSEGVEVRIFYDDVGSIGFLNFGFIKRMEEVGIRCKVFNPALPIVKIFMQNRDHRKITVIDGRVGFTGGYNLADEYFNITHPYGKWKDTGIRLEGEAVNSLTMMFLEMWNTTEKTEPDCSGYLNHFQMEFQDSYVQPYADSPLNGRPVAENVYLNLIKNTKHYFYGTTPYLIISDEMMRELCMAAQRGVDVRLVTPGIPDKKIIYRMTRSYYGMLVKHGVRIYEYTPGFIHEKQMLSDGEIATVGTINMDFRSLRHHFENGVLLYQCEEALAGIAADFAAVFEESTEVTEKYRQEKYRVIRGLNSVLRLFAPLM